MATEWKPEEKIESPIDEKNTVEKGLNYLTNVREFKVGQGENSHRVYREGTVIRASYETHSQDNQGIKIFKGAPDTVVGNTGTYLPTANVEPAAPFNGAMWTDPDNAETIDGLDATAIQGAFKYTIWRSFSGLQDAIPAAAEITGIAVRCYGKASSTDLSPKFNIYLTKDGANVAGTDRFTDNLTTSDSFVSAGNSSQKWGTTWTRDDFGSTFGVMISGSPAATPSITYYLDCVQVVVYYERSFTDDTGETVTDAFMQFWNKVGNVLVYLKKNTLDLLIEKANLILYGSLTVEPQEVFTGNTGAMLPTDNNFPSGFYIGSKWTYPERAYTDDGNVSTADQTSGNKYTIWKGFMDKDKIPDGATIVGILVEAEAKCDTTSKLSFYLTKDGYTTVGVNRHSGDLSGSYAIVEAGSSADLWGTTWSKADFGENFGVQVNGVGTGTNYVYYMDYLQITVYYTTTTDNEIKGNIVPPDNGDYALGSSSYKYGDIYSKIGRFDELVLTRVAGYIPSDDFLCASDLEIAARNDETYYNVKTIRSYSGGSFRMKFDLKNSDGSTVVYGILYRNSDSVNLSDPPGSGTLTSGTTTNSDTYVTFSYDIYGIAPGDRIQLFGKRTAPGGSYSMRNFRIYGKPNSNFVLVREGPT